MPALRAPPAQASPSGLISAPGKRQRQSSSGSEVPLPKVPRPTKGKPRKKGRSKPPKRSDADEEVLAQYQTLHFAAMKERRPHQAALIEVAETHSNERLAEVFRKAVEEVACNLYEAVVAVHQETERSVEDLLADLEEKRAKNGVPRSTIPIAPRSASEGISQGWCKKDGSECEHEECLERLAETVDAVQQVELEKQAKKDQVESWLSDVTSSRINQARNASVTSEDFEAQLTAAWHAETADASQGESARKDSISSQEILSELTTRHRSIDFRRPEDRTPSPEPEPVESVEAEAVIAAQEPEIDPLADAAHEQLFADPDFAVIEADYLPEPGLDPALTLALLELPVDPLEEIEPPTHDAEALALLEMSMYEQTVAWEQAIAQLAATGPKKLEYAMPQETGGVGRERYVRVRCAEVSCQREFPINGKNDGKLCTWCFNKHNADVTKREAGKARVSIANLLNPATQALR